MKWPTNKEAHAYMKMRKVQNIRASKNNRAENWMKGLLTTTDLNWSRQAQWGYRLFDFWNKQKGIAVEVDGPEHNQVYDAIRDQYNFQTSGIIVLRVRNFNEQDASKVITKIFQEQSWNDRRKFLGLKEI